MESLKRLVEDQQQYLAQRDQQLPLIQEFVLLAEQATTQLAREHVAGQISLEEFLSALDRCSILHTLFNSHVSAHRQMEIFQNFDITRWEKKLLPSV